MKFLFMKSLDAIFQINSSVLALTSPITVRDFGQVFAEPAFQPEAASTDDLTFLQIAYLRDNSHSGAGVFHPVAYAGMLQDRLVGINQFGYGPPAPLGAAIEVRDKADFASLVDRLRDSSHILEKKFHATRVAGNGRFIRVLFPNSPRHVWLDRQGMIARSQPQNIEPPVASAAIIPLFPGQRCAGPPPAPL